MHDLVIRGGIVIDGTGAPRRIADVAIDGETITGIGTEVRRGRREIDARMLVTRASSTSTPTTTARPRGIPTSLLHPGTA
jgi:dihydroorotase-like cyclic amidohydrolase